MLDFTFLTEKQIFGKNQLDILRIFGSECAITDFSILLGGYVALDCYTSEGISKKNRTGSWWTKTSCDENACIVLTVGSSHYRKVNKRNVGARPSIPYSSISSHCQNKVMMKNGILEVEYGEYPQTVVNEDFARILESEYSNKTIKQTGKSYTTDSVYFRYSLAPFKARIHIEYEYDGRKYIRFIGDSNCSEEVLSDGRMVQEGTAYWVEVEPIVWLVDEKEDIALSKKLLFSGVQFSIKKNYDGDFEKTNIKWYMDTHFSKDIIPSKVNTEVKETSDTKKINPYNFDYENVSEEDIIRGMVESNIAVFLHGKSSDGKSARVKELDPECEIIYLVNATPDSLNGKTVFNSNTNEMIDIPPTWYIKLKERCEKEPDKIHIVFFDELTNAVPSIQSMAFNIVLNKEVNGKWKLPDNARIVAAGNEYEDSRAANEMVEPLFNRFAHVYINTTVESWLKWASTQVETYERLAYKDDSVPMKIHPSIYAYIAYKSYSKQDVLRTPYDGKTPNADPRKWEMASRVLYKTNNPEMLRSLIGESLTKDFVMFTKRKVITVEDVINGNYTDEDLEMTIAEKYNTAVGLSRVSIEHIEVVRDFVKRLGPEICATFDTLWTHGDNERLEKLMELEINEKTK